MKKLNPDQLVVTSFPTVEAQSNKISRPTIMLTIAEPTFTDPTEMTHCYWCPSPTMDCF